MAGHKPAFVTYEGVWAHVTLIRSGGGNVFFFYASDLLNHREIYE
jgi:hypothetical protein